MDAGQISMVEEGVVDARAQELGQAQEGGEAQAVRREAPQYPVDRRPWQAAREAARARLAAKRAYHGQLQSQLFDTERAVEDLDKEVNEQYRGEWWRAVSLLRLE